MSEQTPEELKAEAARYTALAAESTAQLKQQEQLLSQQQAQLRKLQAAVVDYGRVSVGATPANQQIYANAIIDVNQKIRSLQSQIRTTNAKINELATQSLNQQQAADTFNSQATALENPSTNAVEEEPTPTPIEDVAATPDIPVTATETITEEFTPEALISTPQSVTGPTGTPYDDEGNLNPGWGIDENGNPVWVSADYIEPVQIVPIATPQPINEPIGVPYDEEGNLYPGWTLDENNNPVFVGGDFVEPATYNLTQRGIQASKNTARAQSKIQEQKISQQAKDWRVRLSLATNSNYLYNDRTAPSILAPLRATQGIIFPYLPSISVTYAANYESPDIIHSNYKIFQYKGSAVDNVQIQCDFTAQDTNEAQYLLAVIHFLRSATKMFYGQDENPKNGTPPPLVYLTGLGEFQFNNHPMVISNFQYTLPTDVDYIRAGLPSSADGQSISGYISLNTASNINNQRLSTNNLQPGAKPPLPKFGAVSNTTFVDNATYVPTKMQIAISCYPVVSRYDISTQFSLKQYANGNLLRGSTRSPKRGIW